MRPLGQWGSSLKGGYRYSPSSSLLYSLAPEVNDFLHSNIPPSSEAQSLGLVSRILDSLKL